MIEPVGAGATEIGGDFHWGGLPPEPRLPWPSPCVWFSLGRQSLLALWDHNRRGATVWIPSYFCNHVTNWWKKQGIETRFYEDDPRDAVPVWSTIQAQENDFVLAVNYFGVREGEGWSQWKAAHPDVLLVEDHSHDLHSPWAVHSHADFAFASVRKTFVVPDGGLLWSPRDHPLPPPPLSQNRDASALKFAAMIWKREYLQNPRQDNKATFRKFQLEGEAGLDDGRLEALSPWSAALVEGGFPEAWRRRREHNVRRFLDRVQWNDKVRPLFSTWSKGCCPLAPILLLAGQEERDRLRWQLIKCDVYPPVHWVQEPNLALKAIELSQRILTIPLDQRYGDCEVERVAMHVNDIINDHSS